MAEGMCGLEKMQWVRIARKTLQCHAKGTFFIFARRIARAVIRE